MILQKYYYVPPAPLRKIFNSVVWSSSVDKILVSIDDGPDGTTTEIILKSLDKFNLKSVFFVTAEAAANQRQLIKEILAQGHMIGNHSYSHKRLRFASKPVLQKEIIDSKSVIEDVSGEPVKFFRPPYGAFDPFVLRQIAVSGQKCVMWSLLTGDYLGDVTQSKRITENYLKKNSIVVYHDNSKSIKSFEELIERTVITANEKDFKIGDPSECLR
jgi:peptidoglycan/xylan/chitin deacetylase (PgdA/CDA1 family)